MNAADTIAYLLRQREEASKTAEDKQADRLEVRQPRTVSMEEKYWEVLRKVARENDLLNRVGPTAGEVNLTAALRHVLEPLLPPAPKPKPNYVGEVRHQRTVIAMLDERVVTMCLTCGNVSTISVGAWCKRGHCETPEGDGDGESQVEATEETKSKPKVRQATKGTPEERAAIEAALKATGWHRAKACELLGCSPNTLLRRIQLYGLQQ